MMFLFIQTYMIYYKTNDLDCNQAWTNLMWYVIFVSTSLARPIIRSTIRARKHILACAWLVHIAKQPTLIRILSALSITLVEITIAVTAWNNLQGVPQYCLHFCFVNFSASKAPKSYTLDIFQQPFLCRFQNYQICYYLVQFWLRYYQNTKRKSLKKLTFFVSQ